MKKIVELIFWIGNIFWTPFVAFKTYGYFYKEVGFNLPDLTYLNIFAIGFIVSVFMLSVGTDISIINRTERSEEDPKFIKYRNPTIFICYTLILGLAYLMKTILY